jgi:tRNA-Thr(GGU) m(6)t(6)A37 methyltransferase TsaA
MATAEGYTVRPIGWVRSTLTNRKGAPRQRDEGAPPATLEILEEFLPALDGVTAGQELFALTWLHEAVRDVLIVRPRHDLNNPLTGVFATRSPDRPNPIGLHRVRVLAVERGRFLRVDALEAIDGTPIIDLKIVLNRSDAGWS